MSQNDFRVYVGNEVRKIIELHHDLFSDDFQRLSIRDQLSLQAERIHEAHSEGNETVATHITCWHPQLVGHSVAEIMKYNFTFSDAQETIAREYGFRDWRDVEKNGLSPPNPEFENAANSLLSVDCEKLRDQLAQNPSLVHERSGFGHRSTLLHYVGSNGVETYRQVVPVNLAEIAQVLIDAGADVNATAEMYGGNCTTIALLITSCFPAEAGVVDDVVKVLVDAGAEIDHG